MSFRAYILRLLAAAAVLLAAGAALSPLKDAASGGGRRGLPAAAAPGDALIFGILGGYRPVLADFAWLQAYVAWEKSDMAGCLSNMDLAVRLDPGTSAFWNLGSGIIAYDTPHWILDSRPHTPLQEKNVRMRQGRIALDFLDRGLAAVPGSRRLQLDKALIYERVFSDGKSALKCYEAAARGDAPMFVVRDYARALEGDGRLAEALEVLEAAAPRFDKKHPAYAFYERHMDELKNKLESRENFLDLSGK